MELEARPDCLVCGSRGRPAHSRVSDFLCGSPGTYDYLSCGGCGLLWISPQPPQSTLLELYEQYYGKVQLAPDTNTRATGAKAWIRAAILAAQYRYPTRLPGQRFLKPAGSILAHLPWVGSRARFGLGLMLPTFCPGGRLVDVGCGYGWYVRLLADLGWQALGIEADREVAAAGRARYGAQILDGTLEEQAFTPGSFDAIVTRHSIEHVPDPRRTLLECRRLLRPGGWLGIATPNGRSLASRHFGPHWRGLSAPWHLHLFNPRALRSLMNQVGFQVARIRTTAVSAHWIYCASRAIKEGTYDDSRPVGSSRAFQAIEAMANAITGDFGEELEAIGVSAGQ